MSCCLPRRVGSYFLPAWLTADKGKYPSCFQSKQSGCRYLLVVCTESPWTLHLTQIMIPLRDFSPFWLLLVQEGPDSGSQSFVGRDFRWVGCSRLEMLVCPFIAAHNSPGLELHSLLMKICLTSPQEKCSTHGCGFMLGFYRGWNPSARGKSFRNVAVGNVSLCKERGKGEQLQQHL